MQHVLIEKPYQFVPRVRSNWQQKLLLKTPLLERTLRKQEGVVAHECRNVDRLQKSLALVHLQSEACRDGTRLEVVSDDFNGTATIEPVPFYDRDKSLTHA